MLKDLKNTGSIIDPQDPCVHIEVGGARHETKRKVDAGIEATFDETIVLNVTDDELNGNVTSELYIVPHFSC